MWIFTTSGFLSAVYKDGALQVRARDRKSLGALVTATGATIIATPLADYPYRIAITNEQFSNWLSQQVIAIDYKNFKSEIADTRGYGFAKPLNKVWSVMHEVEDTRARVRKI
jgi:UDP-3-O-acyl-N-acetylglucosamine deacetylase